MLFTYLEYNKCYVKDARTRRLPVTVTPPTNNDDSEDYDDV